MKECLYKAPLPEHVKKNLKRWCARYGVFIGETQKGKMVKCAKCKGYVARNLKGGW